MKVCNKPISFIMAVIIAISAIIIAPIGASAAEADVAEDGATSGTTGDCTWTLNGTELTISGKGSMGDYFYDSTGSDFKASSNTPWWGLKVAKLTISSGVTGIGANAFAGCTGLKSVTIPNTVKRIGWGAFEDCTNLKTITFPDSDMSIEPCAFDYTVWYNSLPDGTVYAGKVAYDMKGKSPSSVTIKAGTLAIGDYAFSTIKNGQGRAIIYGSNQFTDLKKIIIPNTVTSIGKYAFSACYKLKNVTIPPSVKMIGDTALGFYYYYGNYKTNKKKIEGFTICGYENTSAETYAKENGFTFIPVGSLKTPKLTAVQNAASGVSLKWGKITYAGKYRVFRKTGSGKWITLGDTTKASYTDKTAKSGKKYAYTVRCVTKDGKKYTSNYDKKGKSIVYYTAPKLTKIANGRKGVDLTWKKVAGAGAYRVYRCDGKTKKWKSVGTTTAATFTDKTAKSGKAYSYTVRCLAKNKKTLISACDPKGKYTKYLSSPIMNDIYSTNTGVCVTWKKVTGAEKYRILRRGGKTSGWIKMGDTTELYFVDRSAKNKTKYQYTVRCISKDGKKYTSSWKTVGTIIYKR